MNYKTLSDATRSNKYGDGTEEGSDVNQHFYCDNSKHIVDKRSRLSPDWAGSSWYRFIEPAGTKLADQAPGEYHCGTQYPVYLDGYWDQFPATYTEGSHPTSTNKSFIALYQVDGRKNSLQFLIRNITNCGDYFVYYLPDVECPYRYCASN